MKVDIQMKAGRVKSVRKAEADILVRLGKATYVARPEYMTRDMQAVTTAPVAIQTDPEDRPKRKYTRKQKD